MIVVLKRGEMVYHTHSIAAVFEQLDTSEKGLSDESVDERLSRYGRNTLPESEKRFFYMILFDQFKSPIIYVLLIAVVVSVCLLYTSPSPRDPE